MSSEQYTLDHGWRKSQSKDSKKTDVGVAEDDYQVPHDLINEFAESRSARNEEDSIDKIVGCVRRYLKFVEKPVENIEFADIRDFANARAKMGNRQGTINNYLSAISGFHTFLERRHNISLPDVEQISAAEYATQVPEDIERKALTREEVRKLLDAPSNLRNTLIIALLYYTGLRCSELSDLKLNHIDRENKILKVVEGKNNKSREVPYKRNIERLLDRWIGVERKCYSLADDSEYLIVSNRSETITKQRINVIVKEAAEEAGIQDTIGVSSDSREFHYVTPHALRHTAATHMLEDGVEPRYVQKILGHESLETTMRYIHESKEEIFGDYHDNFEG